MGFLADKKILVTGLLSNRSIAFGIAQACHREGATLAFTYVNDELKERVVKLATHFGSVPVLQCDVTRDEQIDALFTSLQAEWGGLDGLVHSIAFAPREALSGDFLNGLSRDGFALAHDVSSYSFSALARGARPLMQGRKAALLTLTYLGAERTVANYNLMGLAKASLEASVRYLAAAGMKVVVFERRAIVGGAAVTEEFHPGFRNSTASYTVSLLQPKIIADLKLAQHGLLIVERPLSNFLPLPDDEYIRIGGDPPGSCSRTQAVVARFSARDAAALPRYYAMLDRGADVLRSLILETPPHAGGG